MAAGRYTSQLTSSTFFVSSSRSSLASLPPVVVLPEPCRPGHQDHGGRHDGEIERHVGLAHQTGEFVVDHADQRLPRRQAADDLLPERALLDVRDEILDHRQRDVGFEQRHAHFAQRVLNVGFGEPRLPAQRLDDAGKAVGEDSSIRS